MYCRVELSEAFTEQRGLRGTVPLPAPGRRNAQADRVELRSQCYAISARRIGKAAVTSRLGDRWEGRDDRAVVGKISRPEHQLVMLARTGKPKAGIHQLRVKARHVRGRRFTQLGFALVVVFRA